MSRTGDGRTGPRPLRTDDGRLDGVRAGRPLLARARRARRAGATAKDQAGAFPVFIADGLPRYHADPRIFPRRRGRVVPGIGGVECVRRSGTAGRRATGIRGSDHRVAAPGPVARRGPIGLALNRRRQFNEPGLRRAEAACRPGFAAALPSAPLADSALLLPFCFLISGSDILAFGDAACVAAVAAPALVDCFAELLGGTPGGLPDSALPLPSCLPVLPSVSTIFVFDPDDAGLAVAPDCGGRRFALAVLFPALGLADLALRRRRQRLLLAGDGPGRVVGVGLALAVRLPGLAHDDLGLRRRQRLRRGQRRMPGVRAGACGR